MDEPLNGGGVRVPWSLRDVVFAGLALIAILGVAVVAGVIALAVMGLTEVEQISVSALLPILFAFEALFIVPAWIWGPRKFGGGWRALGMRRVDWRRGLLILVGGLVLMLAVNWSWSVLVADLDLATQPEVLPLFGEGLGGLLLALLLGAVVAPIAEEVLFRGFIYPGLKTSWGLVLALLVSSALFSVIHGYAGVLPPIFVMGIILVLAYEWTGSLWPPILLHAGMNAVALVGQYIVENYPHLVTGG